MMQISEREDGAIATGQSFNSTKTCKNTFNAPLSWSINGQMSSNHAKSCKFSVRKLGAQPDGPGVTWSGLQARTPWPRQTRIWGVESVWKVWNQSVWSRDVLSAEIHRNPSPNLPWCQHPEPFSPQCTKLSGPWSSQFGERCCISKTCTPAQFKVCPVSTENKPEHTGRKFTHV